MHKPSHPRPYRLRPRHVKHREIHVVPRALEQRARLIQQHVDKLVLPHLADGVHGYRKRHSIYTAIRHVEELEGERIAFDIKSYFASIDKKRLRGLVNRLDPTIWWEIDPFLGANGLRTGPCFSPMLSNLYLNDLDHRFGWVRYCDNIMIVSPDAEKVFTKAQRHLGDIGLTCHKVEMNPLLFLRRPLKGVSCS